MLQYGVTIKQLLCVIFLFFVTSSAHNEHSGKYECSRNSETEQIMGFEADYHQGGLDNPTWRTSSVEQQEPEFSFSRIPIKINPLYTSYSFKYFFPLPKFHFRI